MLVFASGGLGFIFFSVTDIYHVDMTRTLCFVAVDIRPEGRPSIVLILIGELILLFLVPRDFQRPNNVISTQP